MKQTKLYESPRVEIVELELQGVLCLSVITGRGIQIEDDTIGGANGVWMDKVIP